MSEIKEVKSTRTKGVYITVDGIDGSGKTTIIQTLVDKLRERFPRRPVVNFKPLEGPVSGDLVNLVKNAITDPYPQSETALFMAVHLYNWYTHIQPAIASGDIVISDRSHIATLAMQGNGIPHGWFHPFEVDVAIITDIDVTTAIENVKRRSEITGVKADRFEKLSPEYHNNFREKYMQIAMESGGGADKVMVLSMEYLDVNAVVQKLSLHIENLFN